MQTGLEFWIWFNVAVLLLLALDLFVLHPGEHVVSMKEAAGWSVVWVVLSLGFGGLVTWAFGMEKGVQFLTGYVIEYSLSVDNLFMFLMIFGAFKVPPRLQQRVLQWGILGALVMRGAMIGLGVQLVQRFEWILYGFGVFLLVMGVRMFVKQGEGSPEDMPVIRWCRKIPRVTADFHGMKLLVRTAEGWMLTPLAVALVVVDLMDLVFAVDSIPAVFAVTRDPLIVYTSNICAIMGLRSLYFLLAGMARRFHYLHYGLAAVLIFVGLKMLLGGVVHVPDGISLAVVGAALGGSVAWSLMAREGGKEDAAGISRKGRG